jgi:hypothetical protein
MDQATIQFLLRQLGAPLSYTCGLRSRQACNGKQRRALSSRLWLLYFIPTIPFGA